MSQHPNITASDAARRGVSRRSFLGLGAATLGVAALAPVLAGCGGSSTGGRNGRKEVTFACTKQPGSESMQTFVDRYNDSQGTHHVTVRELPPPGSNTEVHQQLVQALGRQDGNVDVFSEDVIWVAEFADAGWTEPMDGHIDADRLADYFPGMITALSWKDTMHGVPWAVDAGQLYYRKDIVPEASVPTTWADLVTVAAAAQESGAADFGYLWQAKQAEILVCTLVEFIASAGGGILGPDGTTVLIGDDPAVEAVQFMRDLIFDSGVSPEDVLSWDEEPSRRPFTAGQAAFLRQWTYVWNVAQDAEQSEVVDKVGVAPLPSFPGGSSAACLGGWQLGVASSSENKDGAIDFANWMSSPATQVEYAGIFGNPPTLSSAYESAELAQSQPGMVQLKDVFAGGTPRPVTPKYPQVSLAIQSAVSGALTTGDVESALRDCATEIERIVSA